MSRLGKQHGAIVTRSSSDSRNQRNNLPEEVATIDGASDYSNEYHHGDQQLSDSPEAAQMGSLGSDEFSGDSGEDRLTPTSGKACMQIRYPSPEPKTRKRRSSKLANGSNRLSMNSTCHSCRRPEKLCVVCSDCPTAFCKRCLLVRHGEDVYEVYNMEINWLCPKCRPGCGRGCETICCNCSLCCNKYKKLPSVGRGEGRRIIKEAISLGWNLHDYQIHLQTKESKRKIANRKLSRGWSTVKASDDGMHSNVITNGPEHLPTKQKVPAQRLREKSISTTGETSARIPDHKSITARVEKLMYTDKKTKRIIPWSQNKKLGSRIMKNEDLTRQSDKLGRCCKRTPATMLHGIDETIWDEEMDLEMINVNDAWRDDRSRKPAGHDSVGRSYEALCNSLTAYSEMAPNIYLMRLWLDREKEISGNQVSITLTDKEIQTKNSISERSLGVQKIAEEFHPAKLKSLFSNEQKRMKQKLNHELGFELTEYVNKRRKQFYEKVDQQMRLDFVKAKNDIDLTIERLTAVVESKVNAIRGNKVKGYRKKYDEEYSE